LVVVVVFTASLVDASGVMVVAVVGCRNFAVNWNM
jgi:hypothetical protein